MAGLNTFTLDAAAWIDPREWQYSAPFRRERYLKWVADRAVFLKKKEIARGVGADGKPLRPVLPKSRPDGATGKPLDPHYAESRAIKWMRSSIGAKGGKVTVWWSHGWGTILDYHRRGARHLPVRDIISSLTPADDKAIRADARHFWLQIHGAAVPKPGGPPPSTVPIAPQVVPRRTPAPVAARPSPGGVVYLRPGEARPKRLRPGTLYVSP